MNGNLGKSRTKRSFSRARFLRARKVFPQYAVAGTRKDSHARHAGQPGPARPIPSRSPMTRLPDVSARPLLIGGMHRSGTSLTAALFASAGLDIGPELLGANPANPMGHFEDVGFFTFHRRALVAQGLGADGFTATARGTVPIALEQEAHALVAARSRPRVAWGWKEPRTTLFLDFWQQRLPDARHVFVFRRPWEVADSLFRRGDDTFALNPAFALDVWAHYNRLIIDFVHRHPTRCLVFDITQVIADPDAMIDAVRSRLDVPLAAPDRLFHDALFDRDAGPTRATIVRALAPHAWETYLELRDLAGVAGEPEIEPEEARLGECAVLEWARASRAAAQARAAEARIDAEVRARLATAAAERRRRRSPAALVEWARTRVIGGAVQAARTLFRRARSGQESPDLLPFPRAATTDVRDQAA